MDGGAVCCDIYQGRCRGNAASRHAAKIARPLQGSLGPLIANCHETGSCCYISRGRFLFQTICDIEAHARERGLWQQDGPCGKIRCNSRRISPTMFDVVLKLPGDVKVSVQTGWGMNTAADAATPTCTRHDGPWLGIMRDLCGFIWDPDI